MVYKNEDYIARIETVDGQDRYFIQYRGQVDQPEVEVSFEIFERYIREFRKPLERKRNEKRRHISSDEFTDSALTDQLSGQMAHAEKLFVASAELSAAITTCTAVQRRRFDLYHTQGFTQKEIAAIEGCSVAAAQKSISEAEKKIKLFVSVK